MKTLRGYVGIALIVAPYYIGKASAALDRIFHRRTP